MRRFLCDDFTAFIPSKFGTFPYKYFTSSDVRYELPGIVSTAFGLLTKSLVYLTSDILDVYHRDLITVYRSYNWSSWITSLFILSCV